MNISLLENVIYFQSYAQHVLLILFGWFARWEVSDHATAAQDLIQNNLTASVYRRQKNLWEKTVRIQVSLIQT